MSIRSSIFYICLIIVLCLGAFKPVRASVLEYNIKLSGKPDSPVTITLKINEAPNDVSAFGLEIIFDLNALEYVGYEKGDLISGSIFFGVSTNLESGIIRIGDVKLEDEKIESGTSGSIVSLFFALKNSTSDTSIKLDNLVDDIEGWDKNTLEIETSESEATDSTINHFLGPESGSCFTSILI